MIVLSLWLCFAAISLETEAFKCDQSTNSQYCEWWEMSDIFHWLVVKKIIDLGKKGSKESGQRQPQLDNQLFCIINFSSG